MPEREFEMTPEILAQSMHVQFGKEISEELLEHIKQFKSWDSFTRIVIAKSFDLYISTTDHPKVMDSNGLVAEDCMVAYWQNGHIKYHRQDPIDAYQKLFGLNLTPAELKSLTDKLEAKVQSFLEIQSGSQKPQD